MVGSRVQNEDEFEALQALLDEARARLLALISGVSEEQFKRRHSQDDAPAGAWSIAEVLAHLLYSERLYAGRIKLALEQDGSPVTPTEAGAADAAARAGRASPVPQLIHGLLASRREIERLLDESKSAEDGLARAVAHPVHGRQTVGWMLRKVVDHEMEHVDQIESIRALLGESGPKS